MTLLDQLLAETVKEVWLGNVTLQSNFARENAPLIAAAASEGYITTKIGGGLYNSQWLPTPAGLEFLQYQLGELIF